MLGAGLDDRIDARRLALDLLDDGLVVNVPEPGTLRLLPPLIIGTPEAEEAIGVMSRAIGRLSAA
jgi:acetylornithine/succinyldiaminopimelate/putrescine aminotransferase